MTIGGLRAVADGQYLSVPAPIANMPWLTTTSIPINKTKGAGSALTEIYTGAWNQLLIGMRTQLSLQTLTELYRVNGQIGIIARMRADVAVEHGPAFAVATYVDD